MSEPEEGYRVSVRVSIDVPMVYNRANGSLRAGWFTEERLSALGFAVEEEAIDQAKAEWLDYDMGYTDVGGRLTDKGRAAWADQQIKADEGTPLYVDLAEHVAQRARTFSGGDGGSVKGEEGGGPVCCEGERAPDLNDRLMEGRGEFYTTKDPGVLNALSTGEYVHPKEGTE